MDRAMALRMSEKMIAKDLIEPLIFEDFKFIVDNTESKMSDEESEVYTKSNLICFLFSNFKYYTIEDYLMTFSTNIITLCRSKDGYNISSRILSACIEDLLLDISRRVETELMLHLYEALEIYLKNKDLFKSRIDLVLKENICEAISVSTLDVAEEFKYEQMEIPGIIEGKKKERPNELLSKTNYYRKDSIRKGIRKYVINNYDENLFSDFINEFNQVIDELDISKYDQVNLKIKYKELIEKLYIYVAPLWLEKEESRDVNQLTLFDYLR